MAITPRSLLKNPTLLVAAIVSALMAMAGITLFAAVFCNTAEEPAPPPVKVDRLAELRTADCNHVLVENGDQIASWTETDWVELAACFERAEDHRHAADAAAWGVGFYPESETLHNVRGYNLIVLEEYDEAVIALRVALQSVRPTTGTLNNNLAWAGLYADDRMTLSEAREHYKKSLDLEPRSCEAIHTGMWVEYGVASRSSGTSRDRALTTYRNLRNSYEPCAARAAYGDEFVRYEVAGAAVLDGEIAKLSMVQAFEKNRINDARPHSMSQNLMAKSIVGLDLSYADVDAACEDIAPVKSARPACRKLVKSSLCRMKRR